MYRRVGTYAGKIPLEELAARFPSFDVAWAPDGHGTTTEHLKLIRDAFRDDLDDAIPGVWAYSMLVALRPEGGNVPMHIDPRPDSTDLLRHHLVLQTNDRCWNFHDGDWQQLEAGGIYVVDPGLVHASINWGNTLRLHLVVDAVAAAVPA